MAAQDHESPRAWLAAVSPEFERAVRELEDATFDTRDAHLPRHIKELVAAAILAFRADPSTETHLRRALTYGATFAELVEAMQTIIVPGGFTCLHYPLQYLRQIEAELGEKASAEQSAFASEAVTAGHAAAAWEWASTHYPDYEQARLQLVANVWTPTKFILAVKYREILASSILAYRSYPTIDAHLRRAIREGASLDQLVEAIQVASIFGGVTCLEFTLPFLTQIQEDLTAGTFS